MAGKMHADAKVVVSCTKDRKGPSFSKGAAVLLRGVESNGSLNKTAHDMHMAYSKAWTMINKVEEGLGFDLIERHGARGSVLTEKGARFLDLYEEYEKDVTDYADAKFKEIFKDFK